MTVELTKLTALAERGRSMLAFGVRPTNSGDWYRIANADGDRAELFIYGAIGSDWYDEDITASQFVKDLRAITAKAIDLHINSPGGLVFDGVAIYSALKNHAATVDVFVDGVAASAASFVAMAGDTITIEKPAKMMIHDARGITVGGPAEHQEMLDLLHELSDTIAEIYADRAGGTVAAWRQKMQATTWFSAADAVKAGLADRVANDSKAAEPEDPPNQPSDPATKGTTAKVKPGSVVMDDDSDTAVPEDRRSQLMRARARVRAGATLGGVKCE